MGANEARGTVLEVEHRRRSGRGVGGGFFVGAGGEVRVLGGGGEWNKKGEGEKEDGEGGDVERGTWEVGLTARQRGVRDGVVLPYLDAQLEGGGGGGRILYDMGVEDDFDEEEDEI